MNDDYRYDLLPHLIQKCGSRLEHLSLAKIGGCVVDAIAKHCKSLRHLKLSFESRYSFGLVESSWKGQGLEAKLQHLEIQTTWFDLGFFFRAVSLHCPNISHLSIDSTGREYKSIEDFCTSFGPTVLDLRLGNGLIENAVLKRICETCPNAVINCVQDYNYGMLSDKALALGTFAACWEVSSRDADFDDSLFSVRDGMPEFATLLCDFVRERRVRELFQQFISFAETEAQAYSIACNEDFFSVYRTHCADCQRVLVGGILVQGALPAAGAVATLRRLANRIAESCFRWWSSMHLSRWG